MNLCNATPNVLYFKFPLACERKGCTEKAHHFSFDRGSLCDDHFLEFVNAGGLKGHLSVTERANDK
jgi:hypothetical protein